MKKISAKWFATGSLMISVIRATPLVATNSASEVAAWNGTVVQTNVSPGLSHIVAIAAGGSHGRALTSRGGVAATAIIHYVDVNGSNPTPPYTSWATAARVIQDAVEVAVGGSEIVVTNGTYAMGGRAVGTGVLLNRVAVDKPLRLRSVNGPQFTVIEGYRVPGPTFDDRAIRCVYLASGGSLSGFTLTNGAAYGEREHDGGGIWCESTNAVLSDCVLSGNSAAGVGGGAYSGTLYNCLLIGNSAETGGGGASGSTLNNCMISGNLAKEGSGGGVLWGVLNNCALTRNSAYAGGGAMNATLNNCTVTGNSASWDGGGVWGGTLNNCIIYFNQAPSGANYGQIFGEPELSFCCVTPLPAYGTGNISLDPQLLDTAHLSASSPCRGAGSSAFATGTDIDGESWGNPPSIGCDEHHPGVATGPLRVTVTATFTNVVTGYPVALTGLIEGHLSVSVWDFGDGLTLTNRPYASHAWTMTGDHAVTLQAYNQSNPGGVSATVMVRVVAQPVYYVAGDNPTPTPPYASWVTAATNIQDAVDAADVSSLPPGSVLVLVTNGTYATGGRTVATVVNRVTVDKPLVMRSVNGPEFTIIEGFQVPGTTNGCGYPAARCVYLTNGASLVGFTLKNGATRSAGDDHLVQSGGGARCESTSVVLSNCIVSGNSSSRLGGGVYRGTLKGCTILTNSSIFGGGAFESILENCTLAGNSAWSGGGVASGYLTNCVLVGNSAIGDLYSSGGGVANCTLDRCTLIANYAGGGGGAMCEDSDILNGTLNNCTLIGNSALQGGGAAGVILNNCTLTGNSASRSGGGAEFCTLNNCIAYFNTAPEGANYNQGEWHSILNYCCVTPLPAQGVGNITNAPLFLDYAGGNLRLQANSPCINAGNNAYVASLTDLDGNSRIVNGTVDIGAYEFQGPGSVVSYAWLQRYGLPTDGSADLADLDADGLNNWQEWRCQSDPNDPRSALRLLSVSANGTSVTVAWQSAAGVSYFLERSTDLGSTSSFTRVRTGIAGQTETTAFRDTNAPSRSPLFYRVGVEP